MHSNLVKQDCIGAIFCGTGTPGFGDTFEQANADVTTTSADHAMIIARTKR